MDKYHWKEHLKMSKIAKFESDLLKTNEVIAPQSRESLQMFVWLRAQTYSPPSANFLNFMELYPHSLKTYHFQIRQFYLH